MAPFAMHCPVCCALDNNGPNRKTQARAIQSKRQMVDFHRFVAPMTRLAKASAEGVAHWLRAAVLLASKYSPVAVGGVGYAPVSLVLAARSAVDESSDNGPER